MAVREMYGLAAGGEAEGGKERGEERRGSRVETTGIERKS